VALVVDPLTKPSDLTGQANGQLSASLLVTPGFPGRASGRAHHIATLAWQALAEECQAATGRTLTVTSLADAYRSYAIQEVTFRTRYTTAVLPGRPYKMWNGERWYQKPGTAIAATPGTSNHGWGLAFDACWWVNGATIGITSSGAGWSWLLANAKRFGFSWEAQSEPWHIRYNPGDNVPAAVLAHHIPTPKPTPLPPQPAPPFVYLGGKMQAVGPHTSYDSRGHKILQQNEWRTIRLHDDARGAHSAAVKVTAIDSQGDGFLTLGGQTDDVNFRAGGGFTGQNTIIARVGDDGAGNPAVTLAAVGAATHLQVTLQGVVLPD
jgi:LAS superfamily LD-carboxypeptidase LdcB